MTKDLTIRPMTRTDLDLALVWAKAEGWNPGLDDAEPLYAADPQGFLMGFVGGQPIGCISVSKYGAGFAFLGLYIVLPAYRGKGYGKAIWDAGLASAPNRSIGLDGVVAQQGNYRKSGFTLAHKSARWGGVPAETQDADRHVLRIEPHHLNAITAYDRTRFPADRTEFLKLWLAHLPSREAAVYVTNNAVKGYGVIRRADHGWKVGPLFADTPAVAGALLAHLIAMAQADTVYIDVPEPNTAAVAIAKTLGLTPAFETARMYLGGAPALPLDRIYGITTLELG
jgi:GNAT superfamily N-acetyltransferase